MVLKEIRIYKRGLERYSGTTPLVWLFSAWFSVSSALPTLSSASARNFSASRAAMHPDPVMVVSP